MYSAFSVDNISLFFSSSSHSTLLLCFVFSFCSSLLLLLLRPTQFRLGTENERENRLSTKEGFFFIIRFRTGIECTHITHGNDHEEKPVFLYSLCTFLFCDALWARFYLHFTRLAHTQLSMNRAIAIQTVASNSSIQCLRLAKKKEEEEGEEKRIYIFILHFVGTGLIAIMYFYTTIW